MKGKYIMKIKRIIIGLSLCLLFGFMAGCTTKPWFWQNDNGNWDDSANNNILLVKPVQK